MQKFILAAAAALAMATPASAFEVYKDYTPSTEVWNVTYVRVNPNRLDDYLEGLRQSGGAAVKSRRSRAPYSSAASSRASRCRTATST